VSKSKVLEHPTAQLKKKIEEQSKMIEALKIDVLILKDLLKRTVQILAKLESEGAVKKGPRLFK
jgi:hypothetical protein